MQKHFFILIQRAIFASKPQNSDLFFRIEDERLPALIFLAQAFVPQKMRVYRKSQNADNLFAKTFAASIHTGPSFAALQAQ